MDIEDKEVLYVNVEEQPPEKVVVDISKEEISFDIIEVKNAVVIVDERKPDLLVLTTGGSLYQFAQGQGYTGTEVEWLSEMLDSKASVQFVVDTIANETQATATTILQLEAQIGNTYAKVTDLNSASATLENAIAQQRTDLEAKIGNDISAKATEINTVIAGLDFAMTEKFSEYNTNFQSNNTSISQLLIGLSNETSARITAITDLSAVFNNDVTARINLVYEAIATEGSVRVTAIENMSAQLTALIGSEINTVTEAISNEAVSRASQIQTLRSDFTDGLSSVITAIRAVETDVEGNTSAIDSVSGVVNNPTTGLTAAFSRANSAYALANGTAGSLSTIEGKVDHPTTGLNAAFTFAGQVLLDAKQNTADSLVILGNNITDPNAGWTANNIFIQSINTKAGNAVTAAGNAQTTANNAASAASTANTELAAIASDSVLSKVEKPAVILNVTNILNEQSGITGEGLRYGITTARTNYTLAISNLVSYLSSLTPSYSDTTQNTPIVASTFRDKFADVYSKRQILLDAIAAEAKRLADLAKDKADDAITAVTTLENNLESTVNDYIGSNSLVLKIEEDLKGNIQTTTTLGSKVTSLDTWKTTEATVKLTSYGTDIGALKSRAFIGVTDTVNGKATVAGVTIDSVNYSLSFQGNIFELLNTAGQQQLYYDSADGVWKFAGSLVAASFKTATSGYRVEMDGSSAFPLWYGQGDKNSSNALFSLDNAGNIKLNNVELTGGLVTNSTGKRGEYKDDGTYLIWLGDGTKNDTNGTFWIKKDGTGFIKGAFFQGEIIETKYASGDSAGVNSPAYAVINWTHNSAGKTIELTGGGTTRGRATGGDYSSVILQATGTLYLAGNIIASSVNQAKGIYNAELNRTEWIINYPLTGISTGHGTGLKSAEYQVIFESIGSTPNFTYIQKTATVKTFENKLE